MNIFWAEMLKKLEISSKCSVEAIKNTTLCKFYKVSPRGLGRWDVMLTVGLPKQ